MNFATIIAKRLISNISKLPLIFLLIINENVYSQSFRWANHAEGDGYEEVLSIASDRFGNSYVTGQIEFQTDFGNGIVLSSYGIHDIFVAKYDPFGNLLWTFNEGGQGGDKGYGIAIDLAGNCYVTGEFEDDADFSGTTIQGSSSNSMFVAKYNDMGVFQWVRSAPSPDNSKGYAITLDNSGGIYVAGGFQSEADFGSTELQSEGNYDIFIAKYDTDGNFQWAESAGGNEIDRAFGITADQSGRIFITGVFQDEIEFDNNDELESEGGSDIFIACYDSTGDYLWSRQAGGSDEEEATSISADRNGNIVVTGSFFGDADFESTTLNTAGNQDIFLASYDRFGNLNWAKNAGGLENDNSRSVTTDLSGNIYLSGDFADNALFDNTSVTSSGSADIFMASYTTSGAFRYMLTAGGTGNDRGRAISVSSTDEIYLGGDFYDVFTIGTNTFTSQLLSDILVSHISSNTTSINENIFSDIKLYPNPATGHIEVSIPSEFISGNSVLTIRSVTGNIIYKKIAETGTLRFNLEDVSNGFYFLEFNSNGNKKFNKSFAVVK